MRKLMLALAMSALTGLGAVAYAEDTLKIGVEAMYPPFESKNEQGQLVGFDIELADAVCAKMQVKCEWVELSFDGLIPALEARKFDFINSNMHITEQRLKVIDFTVPIYDVPSQLVVDKASDLKDLSAESLKEKNIIVGVLQGSSQERYAKKHWQSQGVKVVSYQNQDQVYADLENKRIQGAFQNSGSSLFEHEAGKNFKQIEQFADDKEVLGVGIGFGVRKQDAELKARLNQAIEELKQEGVIKELSTKYFQSDWTAK